MALTNATRRHKYSRGQSKIFAYHIGWKVLAKGQSLLAFDYFLTICARPNWPLPTVEVCFAAVLHNTTNFRKSDYFFKDFSFHCLYLIFFCSSWVYGRFSCRRLGTIFKIVTTNGRDGELSWWEKIYNNSLCVGGKCVQHKAQSAGQLKQASFLHKKGPTLFKRRKWNNFDNLGYSRLLNKRPVVTY